MLQLPEFLQNNTRGSLSILANPKLMGTENTLAFLRAAGVFWAKNCGLSRYSEPEPIPDHEKEATDRRNAWCLERLPTQYTE